MMCRICLISDIKLVGRRLRYFNALLSFYNQLSLSFWLSGVTPYKSLGKLSDILHLNNGNNQLERQAQPPRNVPLDA